MNRIAASAMALVFALGTALPARAQGTFAEIDVPYGGGHVRGVDLNGNGHLDLVVAGREGSGSGNDRITYVNVLLNDGLGVFTLTATYSIHVPWGDFDLAADPRIELSDLNGSGVPDLVVAAGNSAIDVLLNDGHGVFSSSERYPLHRRPNRGMAVRELVVADLNADDHADILYRHGNSVVWARYGTGSGEFGPAVEFLEGDAFSLTVGDVNGNGINDFVACRIIGRGKNAVGYVQVRLGNAAGGFGPPATYRCGECDDAERWPGLALVELRHGGIPDIVIKSAAATAGASLWVMLNDGAGGFSAPFTDGGVYNFMTSGYVGGRPMLALDYTGDGNTDIVAVTKLAIDADKLSAFAGTGLGAVDTLNPLVPENTRGIRFRGYEAADLNGDGRKEIIISYPAASEYPAGIRILYR